VPSGVNVALAVVRVVVRVQKLHHLDGVRVVWWKSDRKTNSFFPSNMGFPAKKSHQYT